MNQLSPQAAPIQARLAKLRASIEKRIEAQGPLPFDVFMELALYEPGLGYYWWHVPGPQSDYLTSPSLTPAFGRLFCRQLEQMWMSLGRPRRFTIVEVGAGNADLAHSALSVAPPDLQEALEWCFVEPLPRIRAVQEARLAELDPSAKWEKSLQGMEPVQGVLVANEVVDNFPFRAFEVADQGPKEVKVGLRDGRFIEVLGELDEQSVQANIETALSHLEAGDRFEVRPQLNEWMRQAAGVIQRGYLLVIDYGDTEPAIWTARPAGTVVTYLDSGLGFDALAEPGSRDITAHVNFSELQRGAASAGWTPRTLLTQRQWLTSLGVGEVLDGLREGRRQAESRKDHGEMLRLLGEAGRVSALIEKGGLGDLRIQIASKGKPEG